MGETVGLRELRQNASEVVRRVEGGQRVMVTVNGREAAELVPVQGRRWRRWEDIAAILTGPGDAELTGELASFDADPRDPFDVP